MGSGWGPPEFNWGAQQWTNQATPTSAVSRKDAVLCMVLHELDPKVVPREGTWNQEGRCDCGRPALSRYTDAGLFLTITHLTASVIPHRMEARWTQEQVCTSQGQQIFIE